MLGLRIYSTDIENKGNLNLPHCLQILIVKLLCAEQSGIYQHLPQLLTDPTHWCMQWTFLPSMGFYIKNRNIKWIYSHKNVISSSVKDVSKYASELNLTIEAEEPEKKLSGRKM